MLQPYAEIKAQMLSMYETKTIHEDVIKVKIFITKMIS